MAKMCRNSPIRAPCEQDDGTAGTRIRKRGARQLEVGGVADRPLRQPLTAASIDSAHRFGSDFRRATPEHDVIDFTCHLRERGDSGPQAIVLVTVGPNLRGTTG